MLLKQNPKFLREFNNREFGGGGGGRDFGPRREGGGFRGRAVTIVTG